MNDDAPFDQNLANQAQAVDQCMKLGAVIIKPPSQQAVGFTLPRPDGVEIARMVANRAQRETR